MSIEMVIDVTATALLRDVRIVALWPKVDKKIVRQKNLNRKSSTRRIKMAVADARVAVQVLLVDPSVDGLPPQRPDQVGVSAWTKTKGQVDGTDHFPLVRNRFFFKVLFSLKKSHVVNSKSISFHFL